MLAISERIHFVLVLKKIEKKPHFSLTNFYRLSRCLLCKSSLNDNVDLKLYFAKYINSKGHLFIHEIIHFDLKFMVFKSFIPVNYPTTTIFYLKLKTKKSTIIFMKIHILCQIMQCLLSWSHCSLNVLITARGSN